MSEARAKLKDAVQSRDIDAILLAIEQGKAFLFLSFFFLISNPPRMEGKLASRAMT